MAKPIVLIGFMGAGKTTIGKVIAEKTGYNFIDTDDLVEINEKMAIPKIFQTKGEPYFRRAETRALKEAIGQPATVIATGGGIVTIAHNQEILDGGILVYLQASPDQIYQNVKQGTSRPLLQNDDVYGTICAMLKDRQGLYEAAAHYTVQVDGKTPEEICSIILGGI